MKQAITAMMILILAALSVDVLGQGYAHVYEKDCFDFIAKIDSAKKNKYKSISVIDYKNEKTAEGKLASIETYDTTGIIKTKLVKAYGGKNYIKTEFYYTTDSRLSKIIKRSDSLDKYPEITKIEYNKEGKVAIMMHKFASFENPFFDTIYYNYNADGNLSSRRFCPQNYSIYYHYDKGGALTNYSHKEDDTIDNRVFNKNGCVIGHQIDTTHFLNESMELDSQCKLLSWAELQYVNSKWIIDHKLEYHYERNAVVVICLAHTNSTIDKKDKLRWQYATRYEYNNNGSLDKEVSMNRREKVIWIKKYVYETY